MATTKDKLDARVRILHAFGGMPYGGIADFQPIRYRDATDEEVLETVAHNLEALQAVLARVAGDQEAEHAELTQYRLAAQGLRFLLGEK